LTHADLLNGAIRPQLTRMTLTLMVGMLTLMGFNLIDTFFVSRLGTLPLAAISFTFPVTFTLISLTIGMGIGTSAVVGACLGQGRLADARRKASAALLYSTALMLSGAVLGWLGSTALFSAMGADASQLALILGYMKIWFAGCSLLSISMVGNAIFRAFGNTRIPSTIMVVASLVNAALDPLLIFGLGPVPSLGLQGAALASVLAWCCGSGLMLWLLIARHRLLAWRGLFAELLTDGRELMRIALPAALANIMTPLAMVLLTGMVARFGPEAVAAYGVGSRLESIACLLVLSLSMTLPPFISQNWAAGQLARVRRAYRGAVQMVLGWQLLIYLLLVLLASSIAAAFSAAPQVQQLIRYYLWILPLGYGLQGVVILTSSSFNALHHPRQALLLSLVRFFVLFVPCSWLGGQLAAMPGLLAGGLMANLVCATLAYLWLNRVLQPVVESP